VPPRQLAQLVMYERYQLIQRGFVAPPPRQQESRRIRCRAHPADSTPATSCSGLEMRVLRPIPDAFKFSPMVLASPSEDRNHPVCRMRRSGGKQALL